MEYICEVLPLPASEQVNGYTHRASLFATDGKGRYFRGSQRASSPVGARANLAVAVIYMHHEDSQLMQDAIEAAGKESQCHTK